MSVSDPLIKDIKGCVLKLYNLSATCGKVTDSSKDLQQLCQLLEKIYNHGLLQNHGGFAKTLDAYTWMSSLARQATFGYKTSVSAVKATKSVHSNLGRFRLLIRHCLMNKCLDQPLQLLNESNKIHTCYTKQSIIGDEILAAILISALLQCNKIHFELDLCNSWFLDLSWEIPDLVKLEVVPCRNLGLCISFSDNKAAIVDITPHSVASERAEIATGDILCSLNGVAIDSSCKGRLQTVLRGYKNKPITLVIAKAFRTHSQDIFPPIQSILRKLQVDLSVATKRDMPTEDNTKTPIPRPGFKLSYLGFLNVGSNGSVKQIEQALKSYVRKRDSNVEHTAMFEVGEMNVKVFDLETEDVLLKHSYMQISSCGSVPDLPNYFAYIAGNENCDCASEFTCYFFHVKSVEDAATILQSMGQGFHRTHFAV